ncbi:MAG: hypothetical protein ACLGIA_08860 [Actinomycetes bacterium]
MIPGLALALGAASLALAVWSLLGAVLNRRPSGPQLVGLAVVEVGLLVQAVVGVVALVRGGHHTSGVVFAGYLLASVLLLPIGTAWGIADRSRWGNGVLAIACAAVAVVVLRLLQVWG